MNSDEGGMLSLVSHYLSSRGVRREVPVCFRVNKRKPGNKEVRYGLYSTNNPNVYGLLVAASPSVVSFLL